MTTVIDNTTAKNPARDLDREPLSAVKIRHLLGLRAEIPNDLDVVYYDTVGSTNTEAKLIAERGKPTLLIAEEQTGGRGRMGKSFFCPRGKGVYMSLLIYPRVSAEDALRLTALAAVATRRAIARLCSVDCGIKWVNDLYLGGKKIAGILTEGRSSADGALEYAIVGIGINLHDCDLGELSAIATSIEKEGGRATTRAELIAEIISEMLVGLDRLDSPELAREYVRHSIIDGRRITVTRGKQARAATALFVGEDLRLFVRFDNGTEEWLSSGDVSLRFD